MNLFRMPDGKRKRGAKALSAKDWIFGSRPRRKLLEAALVRRAPTTGWTRPELALMADVVANGGVDAHLEGLQRLGLLVVSDTQVRTWHPKQPLPPLAIAIRRVLRSLDGVSDAPASGSRSASSSTQAARRAVRAAERAVTTAKSELGSDTVEELLSLLSQIQGRIDGPRRGQ